MRSQRKWLVTRQGNMLSFNRATLGIRYAGLALLALAIGSATLTFDRIIEHHPEANYVGEFAGAVLYPSDVLMLGGLLVWIAGWRLTPNLPLRFGPWYIFAPLLVLLVLSALSGLWAINGTQAGFVSLRRILLLGLYLVFVTESSRGLVPVATALIVFGLLHAVVALVQVFTCSPVGLSQLGELSNSGIGYSRGYGLGFNPNPVGLFLATVSVVAFGLFLLRGQSWPVRALTLATFLTTFLGLLATMSRAAMLGWLGGCFVIVISALASGKVGRGAILKSVAVLVLLGLVAAGSVHLATSTLRTCERSASPPSEVNIIKGVIQRLDTNVVSTAIGNRVADWNLTLPIIKENLAWGVGAGNLPLALKERLIPATYGSVFVPTHNVFLLILAELGVLGGAAWALLAVSPIVWVLFKGRHGAFGVQSLLWVGPLTVILLVSLAEFSPWATQDARLLFPAVLGLWAGGMETERSAEPGPWQKRGQAKLGT